MSFFSDLLQFPFLQYAFTAAVLSSLASGIVGSIIVVRRSTYIAGALAHSILAGLGAAKYARDVFGWQWLPPMAGALIAAVVTACVIGWISTRAKERIDSVLSIIWATGMAVGIVFITKTPGYNQDLMSYLFGSILMVSSSDLLWMLILDFFIIGLALLFYNRILAVCFHEESAMVRGIPVNAYTYLILIITALTIVLLTQIVGIVLVIALLSIPAATASRFTHRLSTMMVGATIASLFYTLAGLVVSYGPELPVGASIILLATAGYVAALLFTGLKK